MSKIAFRELRAQVKAAVWPYPGEADNLVDGHNGHFLTGVIDLAKWVKCLQDNHTDVRQACSTYVNCGKTVTEAPPNGIIKRLYTIVNGDACTQIFYEPEAFNTLECWSRNAMSQFVNPSNTGKPALPQGFKFAEKSTDSPFGRSRVGIWAIYRKRLYVAPWIQSNETLIIEWDGVKNDYQEDDLLDLDYWTPDVVDALKAYMQWQHLRDYEPSASAQDKKDAEMAYQDARADLIYWCEERTRQRPKEYCDQAPLPTQAELVAEAVPATESTVFAIIGDFGNGSADEVAVTGLVNSWLPTYIVTLGNNWYGSTVGLNDLDQKVGQYFSDFLHPYIGSYGAGSDTQLFFAAIGNQDRDPTGKLNLSLQYFALPKAYYDVAKGPIHFFFYDSGYDSSDVNQETDGIAAGSVQAQWLQGKLALSTARFKVVVCHHPPYSSTASSAGAPQAGDGTMSYPTLRLPFKTWGADLLLCGHTNNYERLRTIDGLPVIVAGAGGEPGTTPGEPAAFREAMLAETILRYNSKFGALRGNADCNNLTLEFIASDGSVIDTFTVSK